MARTHGLRHSARGLGIVLIDAPWRYKDYDVIWRGRIYMGRPGAGAEGVDGYFSENDVVTYALGLGRIRTAAEAEREFQRFLTVYNRLGVHRATPAHQTRSDGNEIRLVIGPGSYKEIYLFCSETVDYSALIGSLKPNRNQVKSSCDTIGRLPQ
jgi:hypothetical protein